MAQNEKNYSEQYVPSVNGEVQDSEEVKVTVVDNGNGTVNVTFRDFAISPTSPLPRVRTA